MDKEPLKGFQRLNPQNVEPNNCGPDSDSSTPALDEDDKERLRLAKKLIDGEKMTKTEKRQIYKYLTGNDAPQGNKKGRHAELYRRDIDLAWDYLVARVKENIKASEVAGVYETT